jgi:hypothetical protein
MTYLGDSVYAELDNGMVKLTTRNGLPSDPSNTIFLEPDVFRELVRFVQRQTGENNLLEA